MYYPHFGLNEAPFKITPNTDFFFKGGNRGAILDAVIYAIKEGEGIIKVVGEVGSGKTMICRMLQKNLPETIESIYLAIPSVEPEHVLRAIAFELQLKLPRNADRLKVLQLLQNHLLKRHAKGQQTVIFVEEAQAMPIATLEEIRLLSNLETNQDKLLQIVLFGQPELDINLNELDIRQLRDRITHSFTLGPLESTEIGEYLIFRLRAAGYFGPPLFGNKAIKKIAAASDGLIRRVNILADKTLLAAFSENGYQVTPQHVKAAIKDSEFGQKPVNFKLYFMIASALIIGLIAALIFMSTKVPTVVSGDNNEMPSNATKAPKSAPIQTTPTQQNQSVIDLSKDHIKLTTTKKTDIALQMEQSKQALLALPEKSFSIQIMTAINDKQIMSELNQHREAIDLSKIYLYRHQNNASQQTIILYGHYPSHAEAQQRLETLPWQLHNKSPFIRTIGNIQAEINH
jgi:type II secretory pathway predicted ATPase ExeA